ncbi:hypothetical protein ACH4ZX_04075 [Streptomyces sp. NPDC020490]|uniref:hypothetical protein n=1 Tax=Streptomyces sp. NPDC020490 TaxID=3365078 RepID=UPI00378B92E2
MAHLLEPPVSVAGGVPGAAPPGMTDTVRVRTAETSGDLMATSTRRRPSDRAAG